MNPELIALIATISGLTALGLIAIISTIVIRPNADNTQLITSIIGLLAPTLMAFVAAFRSIQNGKDIKDISVKVDGNLQQALDNAGLVASLSEQVAAGKAAATLAAKTANDTAAALSLKQHDPSSHLQ